MSRPPLRGQPGPGLLPALPGVVVHILPDLNAVVVVLSIKFPNGLLHVAVQLRRSQCQYGPLRRIAGRRQNDQLRRHVRGAPPPTALDHHQPPVGQKSRHRPVPTAVQARVDPAEQGHVLLRLTALCGSRFPPGQQVAACVVVEQMVYIAVVDGGEIWQLPAFLPGISLPGEGLEICAAGPGSVATHGQPPIA